LHDENGKITYDTKIDNLKFHKNLKKRTANQRLWKINSVLFSKQSLPPSQILGLISKTEQVHQNENNSEVNGIDNDNDYEYDKHCKKNELKHFFSDPKIALTDWMQVICMSSLIVFD
jgi:isopentenyldiphosphate isomerase